MSFFGRGIARWRGISGVAVAMLLHDRMKLAGALAGVVFATVLASQQGGVFLGLMRKNTMFVDHAAADVWILPRGSQVLQPGANLPERVVYAAAAVEGVAWSSPLIWATGAITVPGAASEGLTLIGFDATTGRGGPWNVVAGDPASLKQPNAMFFESADRDRFGGLDLGALREINGHEVQVVGFTSGLLPFGPGFSFADIDLARTISGRQHHDPSMVMIGAAPGQDPVALAARLQETFPEYAVFERRALAQNIIRYILTQTAMGVTFGTSTFFGLLVGFVIVALTMFSAVVDNLKEFGTLKAIGATTGDLARILLVQAVIYALVGSGIGLLLVGGMARGMRSPEMSMVLPSWLVLGIPPLMLVICVMSCALGLMRLRNLEPAMVFRG